jgi:hypothetical protein
VTGSHSSRFAGDGNYLLGSWMWNGSASNAGAVTWETVPAARWIGFSSNSHGKLHDDRAGMGVIL